MLFELITTFTSKSGSQPYTGKQTELKNKFKIEKEVFKEGADCTVKKIPKGKLEITST